jgi:gliding motility-associated-like protein
LLTEPEPVLGALEDRVDVLCFGDNSGSIDISASGGVEPYTYLWNTVPPQTGSSAVGLGAGVYLVTITDINGCVGSLEAEIEEPEQPLAGNIDVVNPLCAGDANGSATAVVSGGTAPYTYTWSVNPGLNAPVITDLAAGSYSLQVTDDNGCTLLIPFNLQAPAPLAVVLLSQTDVGCAGENTGAATIQVSGGTAPFTIDWNTTPPTSGSSIASVEAGTYTATISDANGCITTFDVVISEPDEILSLITIASNNPSCSNSGDGNIEVEATGGTAPYTYTWNTIPPTSGAAIAGLEAGSYVVTVVDANGCEETSSFDLIAPEPIIIAVTDLQNVLCAGDATGTVTVSATGGTSPYSYTWNDPLNQTGISATGLLAGSYTVTVTDDNGCVADITVNITEPAEALGGDVISITDVACFGDASGSATVQGTGGSGSYSYQWDDILAQQTSTATGLNPGTYNVTITDNNGCATPVVIEVIVGGPLDAIVLDLTPSVFTGGFNVACADDSTATIDLTISGGTAPYSVLWNLPGLDTSTDEDLSNLAPGEYSVTVTDANGCEAEGSLTLTAPPAISITSTTTESQCFGVPEGSIEIEIFGGVPGYDVLWSGPNGFTSTDLTLTNIEGGVYDLTITDASGCVYTDVVTVTQPEDLVITIDEVSDFNGFNLSCSNSQDGSISITPSGGVPPYAYQWNAPNNPNFSNQQDVVNLPAGFIEVVLTDANGCVQNAVIELTSPDPVEVTFDLSLFPNGFNVSCFGASDGSIEAIATGGTPGYTFTWIGDGGFGPVFLNPIENLPAGEYSVLVQDANNCFFAETVEIFSPGLFAINLIPETINGSNISCNGAADGSINLVINGGEAPVSILWTGPNGFTSTSEDIFGLLAGEYCVEVTDANDCVQSTCITLTEPAPLAVNLIPGIYTNGQNLNCSDSEDGFIDSDVSGGTAPFIYSWSGPGNFTSTSEGIADLAPGNYCLQITDANGCTTQTCVEITAPDPIEILLEIGSEVLCASAGNGSITATVIGGDPAFTFAWTGPDGFTASTDFIENLDPGTYCLTVTDANGCEASECIEVIAPQVLEVTIATSVFEGGVQIGCSGGSNGSATALVSGGTAPYTYSWTGPDGFASSASAISNLPAGTYCIEVTDANDCVFNGCVDLTEPAPILSEPIVVLPDCNTGDLASVDLDVSGGTMPYTFNWSSGETSETVLLESGSYTVIISDANGCEITEVIDITLPSDIGIVLQSPVVAGGFNVACPDEPTGIINTTVTGSAGDLTISWTGPDGFTSDQLSLTLLFAGTYCIEVEDESGCVASECITLTTPDEVVVALDVTNIGCTGNEDGTIVVTASGGTPAYTYEWTGTDGFFAFGPVINQLAPGTYCVIASDANGCRSVETCVDITDAESIDVALTSPEFNGFNIDCFGGNTGSIASTITAGAAPYTYAWTGPSGFTSTAANPTDLLAGEYCLVVTDANACESEPACITLTEPAGIDITADILEYGEGFNTTCNSACDGAIELSLSGGAAPIAVSWAGPNGFTSTDLNISGLCPGDYTVTTTDANACQQSATFTIVPPDPIVITLTSPEFASGDQISCFGETNGLINVAVEGGSPGFTFSWSGPNGFVSTQQNIDNLPAGTYAVLVTDISGCTSNSEITLTEPESALQATSTAAIFPSGDNVSCNGGADGSIVTSTQGGTPPYNYNWLGPDGFNAETADIADLAAGEYTLVVEDVNSCVFTVIVEITEPETVLEVEVNVLQEIACPDEANGGIQVIPSGGTPQYGIEWSGPNGFSSTSFIINNLGSGTYVYTVTDENGCVVTASVVLSEPVPITIEATVSPTLCESSSGFINITISGGAQPYTVLWSNGSTGTGISDLDEGTYTVVVTDAIGCEATSVFEIAKENPLEVNISITDAACFGGASGAFEADLIQGSAPVTYTWTGPDGFSASGASVFNLLIGDYEMTAIDQNGCMITQNATISQPDSLFIESITAFVYPNGFNISTFGGDDGAITSQSIVGGTEPYDYFWTGPDGFALNAEAPIVDLIAGTYQLVVLDNNFCSDTVRITLRQPVPLELPNGMSPNGDGINDNLHVRGLEDFPVNKLLVYNRWGSLIYEENNYSNDSPWEGVNNGGEQIPEGTYFVIVELPDRDNLRGYLELRR